MGERTGIEWCDVPGWPGFKVTRDGAIMGPSGKTLSPITNRSGHLYVLHRLEGREGPMRRLYVHQAVLLAFVGPIPPSMDCRHLDGDPSRNVDTNLAWGTRLENVHDKQRHGTQTRGEKSGTAVLTPSDVMEIRRLHGKKPLRDIAKQFGVSHTTIRRAALGLKWAHLKEGLADA